MGETLRNHSYVNLSLVGDPDRDGVEGIHCHTNLSTCCSEAQGGHRGDWYFPTGSRVPFSGDGDIFQVRRERVVFLRRRNNANMQTGVYRCDVPTSGGSQMRLAVYVGVYTTGGK